MAWMWRCGKSHGALLVLRPENCKAIIRAAKMKHPHWHYFRALCDDLEHCGRFVEIEPANFATYSVEFAHLYLAAGSEIDVVAKMVCRRADPNTKADNINQYQQVICKRYPKLQTVTVILPRHEFSLTPWSSWGGGDNPLWWTSYNHVKHQRDRYFKDANLENTLNALAGLYVLVAYLYAGDKYALRPIPSLMRFDQKLIAWSITSGDPLYCMPDFPKGS